MQKIMYAFFIALINNIDNVSVRIVYSLKGIKINIWINILISLITLIMSTLSAAFGSSLLKFINPIICHFLTMIILVTLGLAFIIEPYIKKKKAQNLVDIIIDPDNADIDNSKSIDLKEAIFLGIALNLNNIGGCFSAGMLNLNIYLIGILSTIISFLALWLGSYVSNIFKNSIICKNVNWIAGIIFIILGIKNLF